MTKSSVLGSASHLSPSGLSGIASLQAPTPVLRCMSDTCMTLNFPFSLILSCGLYGSCWLPLLTVMCAEGTLGPPSKSSGVPFSGISQPSRASTASSPNSTSTAVMVRFESMATFFADRLIHKPASLGSHLSSAWPFLLVPGSSRPTLTSMMTLSSEVSSSSFFLRTWMYALVTTVFPRYRSFSIRCHTSGSRRQEEKTLMLEHFLIVMSVMRRPAWCWGMYSWMAEGRTRKFLSRKKTTRKVTRATEDTWTIVLTCGRGKHAGERIAQHRRASATSLGEE